jgi:hypothetical protein
MTVGNAKVEIMHPGSMEQHVISIDMETFLPELKREKETEL